MCDFKDRWFDMAMADDTIVVNFLLRIRQPSFFNFQWTVHKRRTRRCRKTKPSRATASLTTPLSWTVATSVDGYEGCTRSTRQIHDLRSKVQFRSFFFLLKIPVLVSG
ncbi:hypothetical protein RJT34_01423 [Clitoria ternatea]|uniref:Uncharacterized protein n=1 Tax=Clitoria ternatea TaxID=43366 RepID=A0AAN9KGR6_CLITE